MKTVVLVDERASFRLSFRNTIHDTGLGTVIGEASNGAEFLELIKAKKPDIVFMDSKMPQMDGATATRKALFQYPNLIIIGVSVFDSQRYINEMIDAGAKGYLLKTASNGRVLKEILKNPFRGMFYSEGIGYKNHKKRNGKKTIAIVDDFETTLFTVEFALKRAGYNIIKAQSPTELLSYFDGREIDMLIADYQMPGMLGHELVEKIKGMTKYSALPVLMLSSEKSEKKKHLARQAGAFGWMQKPYDLQRFLNIIDKTLKN